MKKPILLLLLTIFLYSCTIKIGKHEVDENGKVINPICFKVMGKYMEVYGENSYTTYYLVDSNKVAHECSGVEYALAEKNTIYCDTI